VFLISLMHSVCPAHILSFFFFPFIWVSGWKVSNLLKILTQFPPYPCYLISLLDLNILLSAWLSVYWQIILLLLFFTLVAADRKLWTLSLYAGHYTTMLT
jgi:hypothetical protein